MNGAPLAGKSQLRLLLLLTAIFLVNFLMRIVLAPLMPVIERELHLDHAGAGGLFFLIAVGYSAGLLGSGFVSARLGHRRTILLAALGCGLVFLLLSLSHHLLAIQAGLLLLGLVTGIYLPSGISTITDAIRPGDWGKALAVHELAPTMAYLSAPLIVEGMLVFVPWRGVLAAIGATSLALGLAFLRSAAGPAAGGAPSSRNFRPLLANPSFWIMSLLFGLAIGSTLGVYSMLPLFLIAERGFERETANTLMALSRIPVVAMALAAGWISDRFGPKPTIRAAILFTGLTTILLGFLPGRWVIPAMFLQPMLMICFFPAGFTILSRIAPSGTRSLSVALTIFVANLIGAGLFPPILGMFGDRGAFDAAFVLIGVLLLLAVALIGRLVVTDPDGR